MASYDPRVARDKRLREQFNISADEWDEIVAFQGGLCPLCKEEFIKSGKNKGKPKRLVTDHDHKTGLTRGVPCDGCNRRMPSWMTVEWLETVLDYMKNPPAVAALGEERYGRKGRVTNKRRRRSTKRTRRTKK